MFLLHARAQKKLFALLNPSTPRQKRRASVAVWVSSTSEPLVGNWQVFSNFTVDLHFWMTVVWVGTNVSSFDHPDWEIITNLWIAFKVLWENFEQYSSLSVAVTATTRHKRHQDFRRWFFNDNVIHSCNFYRIWQSHDCVWAARIDDACCKEATVTGWSCWTTDTWRSAWRY